MIAAAERDEGILIGIRMPSMMVVGVSELLLSEQEVEAAKIDSVRCCVCG